MTQTNIVGTAPGIEPPEEWLWEAHYTDGTTLCQFGLDGVYHNFGEIEQDRLHTMYFVYQGQEARAPIALLWRPTLKLIHFKMRQTKYMAFTPDEVNTRIYCFGYQEGDSKHIMVIMPDGGIVITDDDAKVVLSYEDAKAMVGLNGEMRQADSPQEQVS